MMTNSYNLERFLCPVLEEAALENRSYFPFTLLEEPTSPMSKSHYLLLTGGSQDERSGVNSISREMSDAGWWQYNTRVQGIEGNQEEPARGRDAEIQAIGAFQF